MPGQPTTAPVTITFFSSAENACTTPLDGMLTLLNDHEISRKFSFTEPSLNLTLPFHDGPGDAYRLVARVPGYYDCGGFVHVNPKVHHTVSLLLIPQGPTLKFPGWGDLLERFPSTARVIAAGVSESEAAQRYATLAAKNPLALASLMNLCAAMQTLSLGGGETPLDFIREVVWDDTLAQDRFFAYSDPAILPLVQAAALEGEFQQECNPQVLHRGATSSYKQSTFDYSNVQLTFHEGDRKNIGGTDCIKIEPDMDLYREVLAHGVGEVIPNLSTHTLTNPLDVLALRWIDAVQSDEPLFDPGYTFA